MSSANCKPIDVNMNKKQKYGYFDHSIPRCHNPKKTSRLGATNDAADPHPLLSMNGTAVLGYISYY